MYLDGLFKTSKLNKTTKFVITWSLCNSYIFFHQHCTLGCIKLWPLVIFWNFFKNEHLTILGYWQYKYTLQKNFYGTLSFYFWSILVWIHPKKKHEVEASWIQPCCHFHPQNKKEKIQKEAQEGKIKFLFIYKSNKK
jgi:hypothetical protein